MSEGLPVIVLVPGAFGTPACFDKLLPSLKEAGYSTHPGPYPSCNPPDPTITTCAHDIASLRDTILLPLLDQQKKDVVILAHSYGGIVAGGAAKNLDKETRATHGQVTGVIGLIYVAGNIALEGESLSHAVGGAHPPFIKIDKPSAGLAVIEPAMDILYNDCDPSSAPELNDSIQPHALLAFDTEATSPAWADKAFDGRRSYVRTLNDCCNPAWLQNSWLEKSQVKWDVANFSTGHMPFISQPMALGAQVAKFIKGFMTL